MGTIKKLTVIDDDEVFTFLTTKAIEKTNLVEEIKVFGNGLEAINFLKENESNPEELPEMILLDLSMPIMDGWQFLDEFVKLNPKVGKKILVYICSSSISPDDVKKAKEISAVSDYIVKPVSKEMLAEIIKNFIP